MKRLSFIILCSMACTLLYAQSSTNSPFTMDSSVRYWDEGPLTFDNFSTRDTEWPVISQFGYNIMYSPKEWKIGNTVIRAYDSRSFMNPYSSWVHSKYRTDELLQYIQTEFDYVEICRRRAMQDYLRGSEFTLGEIIGFHLEVADSFMAKMKEETRQGLDSTAVKDYARRVSLELAQTEDVKYNDLMINPQGFAMGMHIGIASEFYTGPIADYVTPIAGLEYGFDFCFSKVNLYLSGLLGLGGHYKKDIPMGDYQWDAGEQMTGGNLDISFGYTIYESQWWKISPFAGIGVGFIDRPSTPENSSQGPTEINAFRYQFGIAADYKFLRTIGINQATRGLTEFSLRPRFYIAHTSFPIPAPSWTINFGLSVNMLTRIM